MRVEPKDAYFYSWRKFVHWADANGIGDDPSDWEAWWECWKAAYIAAVQ